MGFFSARDDSEALWNAARKLDDARIRALLLKNPTNALLNAHHPVKGTTPLMVACLTKKRKNRDANALAVQHLLEFGADMDAVDRTDYGNTALHYAAYANAPLAVDYMLHAGANAFALNKRGHTPLDVARLRGRKQAADALTHHLALKSGWLQINGASLLPVWKRRWVVALACDLERTHFEVCVFSSPDDLLPRHVLLIDAASRAQPAPRDAVWSDRPHMFQLDRPIVVHNIRDRKFSRDPVTGVTNGHGSVHIKKMVFAADSEAIEHEWVAVLGRTLAAQPLLGIQNALLSSHASQLERLPRSSSSLSFPEPAPHPIASSFSYPELVPRPILSSSSYPEPPTYLPSPTAVVPVSRPSAPTFLGEDDLFYRGPGSVVFPASAPSRSISTMSSQEYPTSAVGYVQNVNAASDYEPPKHVPSPVSAKSEDASPQKSLKRDCVVCMDAERDAICVPCGHIAGCHTCLSAIKQQDPYRASCPICRTTIQRVVKIFEC
uniref:RING-type domain-containing protein n=1 Tax=Globisporangium ultimum (strain ATCC 200006 / CBS 805.95 / DAOM BR144) TaxID=431595 RepID=K3WEP5_GLOUD